AAASAVTPTGMTAVLGGDPAEVAAALERHGLTPANVNGGGQVVAAGTLDQLAALKADPPAKARLVPLQVAGAFHTEHMRPGVETLALKTPDDLDAARDMVARHGQASGLSQNPTWRLVVAPAKGTVRVTALDAGQRVGSGDTVATVTTLRDTYDVVAPHGGLV